MRYSSQSFRAAKVRTVPAVENQPNVFKDEIKEEIAGKKKPLMSVAIAAITRDNKKN